MTFPWRYTKYVECGFYIILNVTATVVTLVPHDCYELLMFKGLPPGVGKWCAIIENCLYSVLKYILHRI